MRKSCPFCPKTFRDKNDLRRHLVKNKNKCYLKDSNVEKFLSMISRPDDPNEETETSSNIYTNELNLRRARFFRIRKLTSMKNCVSDYENEECEITLESFQMSPIETSHLVNEYFLSILNQSTILNALEKLLNLIYFNPICCKNMFWAITNTNIKEGMILFEPLQGQFFRCNTYNGFIHYLEWAIDVIHKKLKNCQLSIKQDAMLGKLFDGILDGGINTGDIYKLINKCYSKKNIVLTYWNSLGVNENNLKNLVKIDKYHFDFVTEAQETMKSNHSYEGAYPNDLFQREVPIVIDPPNVQLNEHECKCKCNCQTTFGNIEWFNVYPQPQKHDKIIDISNGVIADHVNTDHLVECYFPGNNSPMAFIIENDNEVYDLNKIIGNDIFKLLNGNIVSNTETSEYSLNDDSNIFASEEVYKSEFESMKNTLPFAVDEIFKQDPESRNWKPDIDPNTGKVNPRMVEMNGNTVPAIFAMVSEMGGLPKARHKM